MDQRTLSPFVVRNLTHLLCGKSGSVASYKPHQVVEQEHGMRRDSPQPMTQNVKTHKTLAGDGCQLVVGAP